MTDRKESLVNHAPQPVTDPVLEARLMRFAQDLEVVLSELKTLLIEKNRDYGDSALNPIRICSKADTIEQIKVRIDDKLNRLQQGAGDSTEAVYVEDVYRDLLGYLVLFQIARRRRDEEQKRAAQKIPAPIAFVPPDLV